MIDLVANVGRATLGSLATLGRASHFVLRVIQGCASIFGELPVLIRQLYAIGVQTMLITAVSGLFVGMVLALQMYISLVKFGAEDVLGMVVALSLVRELGPVVAALLFAGRAGSALTAEIGLMKATEQLAGLEMMAVDPNRYVFAPRMLAGFISMPLLATLFSALGIVGGYLVGVEVLGVDEGAYWSQMQANVSIAHDLMNGLFKSVVFGFIVTWVALFQGDDCIPTSAGVSQATTRTVVYSSLLVLSLDFIMTALMFN